MPIEGHPRYEEYVTALEHLDRCQLRLEDAQKAGKPDIIKECEGMVSFAAARVEKIRQEMGA